MHGTVELGWITTVSFCVKAPSGKNAPARCVLVMTVPPAGPMVASPQSAFLWHRAPTSIRNLIGSVLPSTSQMVSPVAGSWNPLPLSTGTTSANPSSRDPANAITRYVSPTKTVLGSVCQLTW